MMLDAYITHTIHWMPSSIKETRYPRRRSLLIHRSEEAALEQLKNTRSFALRRTSTSSICVLAASHIWRSYRSSSATRDDIVSSRHSNFLFFLGLQKRVAEHERRFQTFSTHMSSMVSQAEPRAITIYRSNDCGNEGGLPRTEILKERKTFEYCCSGAEGAGEASLGRSGCSEEGAGAAPLGRSKRGEEGVCGRASRSFSLGIRVGRSAVIFGTFREGAGLGSGFGFVLERSNSNQGHWKQRHKVLLLGTVTRSA